jgi:hypothetical protein
MAELSVPLGDTIRIGAMGGGNVGIEKIVFVYNLGLELRAIVSGRRNHFDIGGIVGFASATDHDGDDIAFIGASLGYTWEGASRGTTLSLVPLVFTNGSNDYPGAYATLKWDLAL